MPTGRQSHSTVLVKDKIYFFGGVMDDIECSNEVFYLDLSQQINSEFPPWTDLTLNSGLDFKSCWTTAVLNDDTIYLIGGIIEYQNNDSFTSLVHAFNPNLGQWNIPAIQGKAPERRRNVQAVADGTGNIYVFGGKFDELLGSKFTQFFNDMVILNANDLTWSYGSTVNAPMKRDLYTASLLSDGTIVYIGGREQNADYTLREVDINQINLYDTNLASWSIVQAISNDVVIDSRYLHSAVLVSDGRIIVYGGARNAAQSRYDKVFPDLVVLNTQTFEWTVPEVSSNIDEVPSLNAHTANLFENYMIVAFGNITRTNSFPSAVHNSKIYLLDVNNYTWVNGFASSASTSENQTGKMKIMIGTISGILGVIIFTAIGIIGYKMYQKRKLRDAESNTKVIS